MSYVSLSGLSAAQLDLNTTSNNIANANTYGFKESRAEFGDVYSNSLFTNAKTTPGGGAQASKVAQQFHEGRVFIPTTQWTFVSAVQVSLPWQKIASLRSKTN
ncbi:flagellar hook protein FlgE [Vibrio maritimus]|uniref:Flagellar hook protein FlgE n=1 Tax=Vibrio maritimus TaxID=990268 RepID=A0A090SZQ0_9VIBR|nr:flagellar hook protein FlgE [Vibrio maritimus]